MHAIDYKEVLKISGKIGTEVNNRWYGLNELKRKNKDGILKVNWQINNLALGSGIQSHRFGQNYRWKW